MTIEAELFDGTVLEFPDGTDPQVIQKVVKAQTAQRRQAAPQAQTGDLVTDAATGTPMGTLPPRADAPTAPQPAPAAPQGWGDWLGGMGASLADGARQGISMVAGAPVDLVNNAPRLANILPGVDGVGPITSDPIGGSASVDNVLRLFGLIPDYQPRSGGERIANRIGQEVGATALPVAGVLGKAASMPIATVNRMASAPTSVGQGIAGQFLQPAAVNPAGLASREAAYAVASGAGAGVANEVAGENRGDMSDFVGSLLGALGLGAGSAILGAGKNMFAGATGNPGFMDDVAGEVVSDRLINNSTQMQDQFARTGRIDTQDLANALRRQAPVEEAVPGYRANIGDRAQDPGLATFAFNQDAVSPGAANARRASNDAAVNARMGEIAPQGDPTRFRADLQTGVDNQIGQAVSEADLKRAIFGDAEQAVQPAIPDATARGSSIRSGLSEAYDAAQGNVRQLYEPINDRDTLLDPTQLVRGTQAVDTNLAPNDAKRFRPTEADTVQDMTPGPRAPLRDTGIVNEFNRPIFAENTPKPTTVPASDVVAIRRGLTDDIRAANASGQTQQARVLGQYIETIDDYLANALPPQMREQLDVARAARRDVGDRFERPGTGIAEVLRPREGGGYALDDSAVGPRFTPTDQGSVTDFRALMKEAGSDTRVRDGLTSEVLSDVKTRGLTNKPDQLAKYMSERSIVLNEFPEVRTALEGAGVAKRDLDAAERIAADTTKRLTTPGRSAEASYLRQVEDPAMAMRTVTTSPDPRKAVKDLLTTAGTPEAKADLRAALWSEVQRSGKMDAPGVTGETRWNGKKLRAMFEDPKFKAVAEELWADDPDDLKNIKGVFDALATAEGSARARAAGSSGTAQSLAGKFDPSLSVSSIASRARSVNRGQLSPTIAVVDVVGTWLRNKSAQVQARSIDNIASAVVNNPGMAADLLEKYNPATAAARRAMLTQKYGVRATQVLNILDEAENEDPVLDAVGEK